MAIQDEKITNEADFRYFLRWCASPPGCQHLRENGFGERFVRQHFQDLFVEVDGADAPADAAADADEDGEGPAADPADGVDGPVLPDAAAPRPRVPAVVGVPAAAAAAEEPAGPAIVEEAGGGSFQDV